MFFVVLAPQNVGITVTGVGKFGSLARIVGRGHTLFVKVVVSQVLNLQIFARPFFGRGGFVGVAGFGYLLKVGAEGMRIIVANGRQH